MKRAAKILLAAVLASACGDSPTTPSPTPTPSAPAVLVGAGDIADCAVRGSEATAQLLDRTAGTVFTAGDNAYPSGSAADYRNCYEPTWGRHRDRTRPAPGNHEYETAAAAPYFEYFGALAGPPGLGYYSFNVGSWHVVSLNSEVSARPGSAQTEWLRGDLAAHRVQCTAAIWHRPLFSSGANGDNPDMLELWRILYEFGADVVITGHDHSYERFAPQDPSGTPDPAQGIRQFIVGTGGAALRPHRAPRPNSEARGVAWGVLVLRLEAGSYSWEFVPVDGGSFRDSGSGQCH
jgi:hypothetical protein